MSDTVRLSIKFFEEVKGFKRDARGRIEANDGYKESVSKSVDQILAGGMKPQELDRLMTEYITTHPTPQETYNVDDILKYMKVTAKKVEVKVDPDNLLMRGQFYCHPQLQIAPPPPVIEILPDGTFKASYEEDPEFYLEIKDKYTIDDLLDYFYSRTGIKPKSRKRDRGGIEYLLRIADLDLILYSIDEASVMYIDTNGQPPRNPLDVQDYFDAGEAILEDRKNTLEMEGLNHVIPRSQ